MLPHFCAVAKLYGNKRLFKKYFSFPLQIAFCKIVYAWFPYNLLVPATHRRPTVNIEERLKIIQLFSIAMPRTSRNLYGNMTAIGSRWVDGSFRSLIGFYITKNDFHFSFILKFSAEESSSPVGRR